MKLGAYTHFHDQAEAAAKAKDAALLLKTGREYAAWREEHREPFREADKAMADIIEGFTAHKGDVQ